MIIDMTQALFSFVDCLDNPLGLVCVVIPSPIMSGYVNLAVRPHEISINGLALVIIIVDHRLICKIGSRKPIKRTITFVSPRSEINNVEGELAPIMLLFQV